MDCVNHPGVSVSAYCQNCGKPLCSACVRQGQAGQILCEPCYAAWQSAQQTPFVPPQTGIPNPGIAAVLGIIPGVGAMYNGQFFKGFIHVIIFAILISLTSSVHSGLTVFFALLIPAWVLYQSFDAHQTALARRAGLPLPDPLGLNELGNWFQTAFQNEYRRTHTPPPPFTNPYRGPASGPYAGSSTPPASTGAGPAAGPYQAPFSNPYQSGYQPPPFTGVPPASGFSPGAPPASGFMPGAPPAAGYTPGYPPVPPIPPVPPMYWRRREPIAAIVLIALGLLFLAGQLDWFSGRFFEFTWPLLLIALGAWLVLRRMQESAPPQPPGNGHTEQHEDSTGNRREIL
jgi:TM2 domain-containing membrane protein YozV